jgi:uncharacterized protein
MIAKFNLKAMKSSKTFLAKLSILTKAMNAKKSNSQLVYAYQQRIKSLNFATIIFRSDIAFVTFKLTQYLQALISNHLAAVDRFISYLNETKNLVIEYSNTQIIDILLCASDAAFANDEATRKSFDNYLFQLYDDLID